MKRSKHHTTQSGFSLIQLSILMTVVALVAVVALPRDDASKAGRQEITLKRMSAIEGALQGYRAANRSFPCPADGTLPTSAETFGLEMGLPGNCNEGNFGASGNVVGGVIPVRSLGLPVEYATDGWGHRFNYAVDIRATRPKTIISPEDTVSYNCSGDGTVTFIAPHSLRILTSEQITVSGMEDLPEACGSGLGGGGRGGGMDVGTEGGGGGGHTVYEISDTATATSLSFALPDNPRTDPKDGSISGITIARADEEASCEDIGTYDIQVQRPDGGGDTTSPMVLISHGANGSGAFPSNGSSVNARLPDGSADENSNGSVNTGFDSVFVQRSPASDFDDIVHFTDRCL